MEHTDEIGKNVWAYEMEEEEIINGNYYTFKLQTHKGFLYRYNETLGRSDFVFSFNGSYWPIPANKVRDKSTVLIPCSSILDDVVKDLRYLKLVFFFSSFDRMFVIYDYQMTNYRDTHSSVYTVVDYVPNVYTGEFDPVYAWQRVYEPEDATVRYGAIVNKEGIHKTVSLPRTGHILSRGDKIFIINESDVTCIDFITGKILFAYKGEDGTRIYDVACAANGKYIAVGSTKNQGYIDYENPYVVLLDKEGKKLSDGYAAVKDMKITRISGYTLYCSNKPDHAFEHLYRGKMSWWYEEAEENYGDKAFNTCTIPLSINNNNTVTLGTPSELVGKTYFSFRQYRPSYL